MVTIIVTAMLIACGKWVWNELDLGRTLKKEIRRRQADEEETGEDK